MHLVILDTNVLISALIQKNYPHLILNHCIDRRATLCLSPLVLREYLEVINRPKFARFPDFKSNGEFVIVRLTEIADFFDPAIKVDLIADEADNRFLELAAASRADFLITGNTNDFTFEAYRSTRIVSPKNYWYKHRF